MNQSDQSVGALAAVYALAPDLEVVPLGAEAWLCKTATASCELRGASANFVVEQLLPALKNGCDWAKLQTMFAVVEPIELWRALQQLLAAGVAHVYAAPAELTTVDPTLAPLLFLLDAMHVSRAAALERLADSRIAIVGLEGVGAHLALLLARCNVRRFNLIDPFACQPGNLTLLPVGAPCSLGQPRQELVATALRASAADPAALDIRLGPVSLTAETLGAALDGCDFVASCFDRGFAASHYWVNRYALRAAIPAVFVALEGHLGWAGPLSLAGKTACYTCYRRRAIACEPDSTAALAHEVVLDRQKSPQLHQRAVLPALAPQLAGMLATATLQTLLGLEQPTLAGQVAVCDALAPSITLCPILQQPDCPDCGGGAGPDPALPDLAALRAMGDHCADINQLAGTLVNPHTGIAQELTWHDKDASEPTIPFICAVKLANYSLRGDLREEDRVCWGKGLHQAAARASALGEAVERYAADQPSGAAIVYARRDQLDGPSLDPRRLPLYAPWQYANLPYQPYSPASTLGWVKGRAVADGPLYIPATAVFMGYQPRFAAENLFGVNSNGLAAGPNLTRAILAGAYEVVERDAFTITWLARLPAQRVDPFTHPDPAVRDLCQLHRRRGIELGLWRLPSDHSCAVFLALGMESEPGPAFITGLGADLAPVAAARKALLEVGQIRPSYRRSLRRVDTRARIAELLADPQRVSSMRDHGLLYCSQLMRPALAFLLDQAAQPFEWGPLEVGDPQTQLETLARQLAASNSELLYYNLTPRDIARLGLAVVRVIATDFQPIAFGASEQRLGGTRLFELPQRLGFAAAPLTPGDLNPYPHLFD